MPSHMEATLLDKVKRLNFLKDGPKRLLFASIYFSAAKMQCFYIHLNHDGDL